MSARIAPAEPPFPDDIAEMIGRIVPEGMPPFRLFTTVARDPRLFDRFVGRGFMGKGNLSLRQRELVVDRTTALGGSEYEWGLHIYFFAEKLGFTEEQIYSLVHGTPTDPCWSAEDQVVLRLCDALHFGCDVDDPLWADLKARFSDEAIMEMIMVAGNYRAVCYVTNALRLPPEACAPRFPERREA